MRIALIQLGYDDAASVADRTARAADLVRAQRGHDLVVLPELWAPGGFDYRSWSERAETVHGPTAQAMAAAARDAGVVLHAGSIVERPAGGERGPEGKDLWNTSLVFAADGTLLATYRKIHRFGFARGEPSLMEAGDEVALVDLPDGAGGTRPRGPVHLLRPALPRALPRPARRGRHRVRRPRRRGRWPGSGTGPCWPAPARSRTSAWSWPATPPAPTRAP